jgi:lipoate-protein ligase B
MTRPLRVVRLGRRPYRPVLELQRALVQARIAGRVRDDLLLLVEHDPVVTLGRGTRETSLPLGRGLLEARGFTVEEVERGGDVTVHAPGQLVGYPILDLTGHREDVHWYLRQIEESLILALGGFGVAAGRNPGYTGVWTSGRKIASIGIHVKRWVTLHGFALNVTTDLSVFDVVVPCGIEGVVMTSVEAERRRGGGAEGGLWARSLEKVTAAFGEVFDLEPAPWSVAEVEAMTRVRSVHDA